MDILTKLPYITKQNLALALSKKPEAVNYFIKQALKKGELISLKKGLFVSLSYADKNLKDASERQNYIEYLSNILREPSYVSLEYVLAKEGMIPESAAVITAVTTKTSRVFRTKMADFSYRQIKKDLFFGYDLNNFKDKKRRIASLPKALFDYLYFKKFNNAGEIRDYLCQKGRFNWEVFTKEKKERFREIVSISKSEKMKIISRQIEKIC